MTSIPGGEVSATKFSTAFGRAGCGMKFYYRYVEGLRGVVGASLLAGIAFDHAARHLHDARINGESIEASELAASFHHSYTNPDEVNRDGEPIMYDLSDEPDDLFGRAENALTTYANTTTSMIPVETQKRVEAEFEETDAKLVGFIDLVERTDSGLVVTDVKTSLSGRKKWTVEDAARDAQLGIYSLLLSLSNTADVIVGVGWRYARLGGKVDVGAAHVAAPNNQRIMERVSYWMGELERWCETGNFPATGLDKDAWVCSEKYCDYYNRCPHGRASQTIVPLTIGGKK